MYLEGQRPSQIVRHVGHSSTWFYKWWNRFVEGGPDQLEERSRAPHNVVKKTDPQVEQAILCLRRLREARESSQTKYALVGAPALQRELQALGCAQIPAISTIEQILRRHGLTHPNGKAQKPHATREYPQPQAQNPNDVQQLDLVGPWYLSNQAIKHYFYVLKDVASLAVWVDAFDNRKADTVVDFLIESFKTLGIPSILQVDNGLEFRGSNKYPRSLGRVIRLCLHLGIEILFIPEKHPWRNGSVENFNGMIEEVFLKLQAFANLQDVKQELPRFVLCCNREHPHLPLDYKTSEEFRQGYVIRTLASDFQLPKKSLPIAEGAISFIRRVRKSGRITILTETFDIDPELAWEYVYATIYTKEQVLKVLHKEHLVKTFEYMLSSSSI